jgi:hypothetical protein
LNHSIIVPMQIPFQRKMGFTFTITMGFL